MVGRKTPSQRTGGVKGTIAATPSGAKGTTATLQRRERHHRSAPSEVKGTFTESESVKVPFTPAAAGRLGPSQLVPRSEGDLHSEASEAMATFAPRFTLWVGLSRRWEQPRWPSAEARTVRRKQPQRWSGRRRTYGSSPKPSARAHSAEAPGGREPAREARKQPRRQSARRYNPAGPQSAQHGSAEGPSPGTRGAEATPKVVVDHASRLHEGVAGGRAEEGEAALLQVLRHSR